MDIRDDFRSLPILRERNEKQTNRTKTPSQSQSVKENIAINSRFFCKIFFCLG